MLTWHIASFPGRIEHPRIYHLQCINNVIKYIRRRVRNVIYKAILFSSLRRSVRRPLFTPTISRSTPTFVFAPNPLPT